MTITTLEMPIYIPTGNFSPLNKNAMVQHPRLWRSNQIPTHTGSAAAERLGMTSAEGTRGVHECALVSDRAPRDS